MVRYCSYIQYTAIILLSTTRGQSLDITARLTPDVAQRLSVWIGCYTFTRNLKVNAYREQIAGLAPSDYPTANQAYASLCKDFDFLAEVPSQIRRNAASKWFEHWKAWRAGVRALPKARKRGRPWSAFLTNELFSLRHLGAQGTEIGIRQSPSHPPFLRITVPWPVDTLRQGVYIKRHGARFWLSYSRDVTFDADRQEVLDDLKSMSSSDLRTVTLGIDAGVAKPFMDSTGTVYRLGDDQSRRVHRKEARIRRYQRKLARQRTHKLRGQKPSNRMEATKAKVRREQARLANVRTNQAHHISRTIVDDPTVRVVVVEDLKIVNMTAKPRARWSDAERRWRANGARRKAGLNRAILGVAWGKTYQFLNYKLEAAGKVLVKRAPHFSSQRCSDCGHTAAENRRSQDCFVCTACGAQKNADHNAALNLRDGFVEDLRNGTFVDHKTKPAKRLSVRKRTGVGQESSHEKTDVGARIRPETQAAA